MLYTVRIHHTDLSFPCDTKQTVLDAAEQAGFALPYSCRKGVCSSCVGTLERGELTIRGQGIAMGPRDNVLLCQARPNCDVEITPSRIRRAENVARKKLQAKVHKIEWQTTDVIVLQLRFPNGIRAAFKAGQYLRLFLPDGSTRNYSMANPPNENDGVQLHIRRIIGGVFSDVTLKSLSTGARMSVELPFGEFSMDTTLSLPAILLATGTGFAPVKSMVEDQIRRRTTRPMHLFWGARTEEDLYMSSLPQRWTKFPWFSFTPVLSAPSSEWAGAVGHVQDIAISQYSDLSGAEAFVCGSLSMVEAAKSALCSRAGLRGHDFYSDAFVSSNLNECTQSDQIGST
jgi:NAD(P)H-flavin reductase/ferredoxin